MEQAESDQMLYFVGTALGLLGAGRTDAAKDVLWDLADQLINSTAVPNTPEGNAPRKEL